MPDTRCGPLAAWANAFFAGLVSLDQAVDAVTGTDAPHQVLDCPGCTASAPLREALVAWRRAHAVLRVSLPVPGDVRGLPGPAAFRTAALDAGEAVHGATLGLVPKIIDHAPSSAPPSVLWSAFVVDAAPADYESIDDVEYELRAAIRESARALVTADVGGGSVAPDAVAGARRAGERPNLPPGFPQRAVGLLAQADRLQAALDLAQADPFGGAVDGAGVAARGAALRPLATAVRRARIVAYNAGVPG